MTFLNKLERRFGKYAIPNLIIYIIGAYIIGFALYYLGNNVNAIGYLTLDPYYIIHGLQLWRLFSWLFVPYSVSILSLIFMPMFYFFLGRTLEQVWGTFRFNVYLIGGILMTDIGAFILFFILKAVTGIDIPFGATFGNPFSTYYLNMSLFLAFAMTFPEQKVYIYFVIPVKYKWMALVYAGFLVYEFIVGGWVGRVAMLSSLLNFIIFFFMALRHGSMKAKVRQAVKPKRHEGVIDAKFKEVAKEPRHKCAICGRTEKDNPNLQFRYCSKCDGNYEYCQEHLLTLEHIHIKYGD